MIGKLITSNSDVNKIMEVYLDLMGKNKNKVVSVEELTNEILNKYPDLKIDEEIVFDVLFKGSHECTRFDKLFFNSQSILFNMDNSLGGGIDCGVPRRIRENNK